MDISIVIPVYNEEKNLPVLHKQIRVVFDSLNRDYEIIYIDDGSTDNSFRILNEIALEDNRVRLISFDKNYGQTSALEAGICNAKGDFILTVDADLAYDIGDLMRILRELKDSDVVIGYRSNRKNADGYIKFISSKIANYARNKILKENFRDVGCFLRGFRKGCLNKLVLYKGFQVFIISLLGIAGYRIKEIEVKVRPRRYGKSKYNIRNRLFKEAVALFIVKWMQTNLLRYKIKYCNKI